MFPIFIPLISTILAVQGALAVPVSSAAAATVGKIRGVQDPIYHLYLQANPKNGRLCLPSCNQEHNLT